MTEKSAVLETVRKLFEEASYEEIIEAIAILAAIKRDEAAADAGREVGREEVKQMLASWAAN